MVIYILKKDQKVTYLLQETKWYGLYKSCYITPLGLSVVCYVWFIWVAISLLGVLIYNQFYLIISFKMFNQQFIKFLDYLEKSWLTRRSRQSLSKLRKPNVSPRCSSPVKILYMNWNGRVDATSIGNQSFVRYLI